MMRYCRNMSPTLNPLAQAIGRAMAEHGWDDRRAAEVLDVSAATVNRWRLGHVVVPHTHAARVAAFCGMKVKEVDRMIDRALRDRVVPEVVAGEHETLGALLQALEIERGLSAPDLFTSAGIDRSAYYRWRRDQAGPALADVPWAAAALGVDEMRMLHAVYRTELARVARLRGEHRARASVG